MRNLTWAVVSAVFAIAAAAPAVSLADAVPAVPVSDSQGLEACFWSHVTEADKTDYAAIFHTAAVAGYSQHASDVSHWVIQKQPEWDAAFAQCDTHPKIPRRLVFGFTSSQFDQFGAFRELAANAQITRDELDQTWTKAPETSQQCERAQAGMALGGTKLTCPDTTAIFWFGNDLRTRHTLDDKRGDTLMVIMYMGAKARGEVAEAKIADFEKSSVSTGH